ANWCCLCWGQELECVGSGVLMEMGEWSGRKRCRQAWREKGCTGEQ
nr:hypothetical protein [Tanacetum cinerariifolium]